MTRPAFDLRSMWTLFRHEMRMVLRDRRTLVLSLVLPSVAFPVMVLATRWSSRQRDHRLNSAVYAYSLVGPLAADVRAWLAGAGEAAPAVRFTEVTSTDPPADLASGRLELYLEAVRPEDAGRWEGCVDPARPGRRGPDPPACVPGTPVTRVYYRGNRDASAFASQRMREHLRELRAQRQGARLREQGLDIDLTRVAAARPHSVATEREVAGSLLGRFVTVLLVVFTVMGGSVASSDTVAGEKERGTLETLLTTAVGRHEVVAAKLLGILAVALATTAVYAANMFLHVGLRLLDPPPGLAASLTPATAAGVFLLFIPIAVLLSGLLLLVSARSRSFKESQLYLQPVLLLSMVPPLAAVLPGIELRSVVAILPVANLSVAVRDLLMGRPDWPLIALSWLVTSAAAAWLLAVVGRSLSAERLMAVAETSEAELRGGPLLFPRRVLLWFAAMWAILIVGSNFLARADLRSQLLFNLVVVILGGAMLAVRRYRLPVREALSLRRPPAAAWVAVLLGAPAGFVASLGLFELGGRFLPVPERVIEDFQRALLPQGMSLFETLFLVAVLPAVCEEIAFRGVLLHGLKGRFRPAVVCLLVGAAFGLFHMAYFRLLPAAALGVVLAAVTLLSGSIFPAMAWHALNNAIGVLLTRADVSLDGLEPRVHLAATAVLAVAMWILGRHRTPR